MITTALLAADDPTPAELARLPWTGHDTRLLIVTIAAIVLIVLLISWLKINPFLSLILGSAALSIGAGVPVADSIVNFEKGVGDTLKEVGLLIALGAMLGKLLADSGGANRVVDRLLAKANPRTLPWLMALVAAIIGLPMFFEIGLVLLLPVIVLVATRAKLPLMLVGIPALAGLSVLHGLVPPHPGPLIAIDALGAPLGLTLAFGLLTAIPTVIICGPLFGRLAAKMVPVSAANAPMSAVTASSGGGTDTANDDGSSLTTHQDPEVKRPPSFGITVATILFPVVLMLVRAVLDVIFEDDPDNALRKIFDFLGQPLVAMVLAVVLAMITFGYAVGFSPASVSSRIGASVGPIALIVFIVGAGGGFKQSLISAGAGVTMAKAAIAMGLSVLLSAWLLAVLIRLATGSATVATTTAAGIVATMAAANGLSPTQAALVALAIGAGSLFLSHVNDAGFWLVKESFGLTVGQTFRTWSAMETLISVVGFGVVSIIWAFV